MTRTRKEHFQWQGDTLVLHCLLQTRAAKDEIIGPIDGRLKIRISAPPIDGKANLHLSQFLAERFGVAKSRVEIRRGETSRLKTLAIIGPTRIPDACEISR